MESFHPPKTLRKCAHCADGETEAPKSCCGACGTLGVSTDPAPLISALYREVWGGMLPSEGHRWLPGGGDIVLGYDS